MIWKTKLTWSDSHQWFKWIIFNCAQAATTNYQWISNVNPLVISQHIIFSIVQFQVHFSIFDQNKQALKTTQKEVMYKINTIIKAIN